ncbi:DUF4231 domain-containing protein [Robiginitalea biformata]|uniref:DUF4231 domain-containing protein n=1 Tax=Robiginitalea biformata (strain ATCC BAA-864 / DSM 15991 / KCTC 12146 / HTCC2501) TaxID=313596 RepID=A4CGS3_ROBBH|nr:DUF4231 domain-containing protein [Robiginitalea biformata]EAR16131.1 hypothetical protein RB2501_04515 [Robiginitalea biformata HTCC2501]
MEMNEEQFMRDRVDDQLNWYRKKSTRNKKYHMLFSGIIIVSGSLIPLVAGYSQWNSQFDGLLVACLGVLTAMATGIAALYKFQEKWLSYRTAAEALLREKILYQTRTRAYAGNREAYALFVSNVEDILSNENRGWNEIMASSGASEAGA